MAEFRWRSGIPAAARPVFGDQDSGRVLPGRAPSRPPTHDHVIWLAAALLGQDRPLDATAAP